MKCYSGKELRNEGSCTFTPALCAKSIHAQIQLASISRPTCNSPFPQATIIGACVASVVLLQSPNAPSLDVWCSGQDAAAYLHLSQIREVSW